MNRSDILLQVKDAESKAQQIVKEAEEKQRATVTAARREAATRVNEADEKLRAEYDSRFAKERESIASEKQTYLNKGKKRPRRSRPRPKPRSPA